MSSELTLHLNSPISEEQWDAIEDVDFDRTDRIWFHTKHGKDVEFIKAPQWIPFKIWKPDPNEIEENPDWTYVLDEHLPDDGQRILVNCVYRGHEAVQPDEFYSDVDGCYLKSGYKIGTEVNAWMPLPEPYRKHERTRH